MTEPRELTENRLDELLADARTSWRVPPSGPDAGVWDAIDDAHFGARASRRRAPGWRVWITGVAAALALGVGVGRWSAVNQAPDANLAAAPNAVVNDAGAPGPFSQATTEYLGETAALLAALPRNDAAGNSDARFALQAGELLTTTRLLLDSPSAQDPRLQSLLEDLELVLAQIARLPARRGGEELDLIREALEQRDVVPRLRLAAAAFSAGDD
jgi:hypothetical protein